MRRARSLPLALASLALVACAAEADAGGDDAATGGSAIANGTPIDERSSTVGQLVYERQREDGAKQSNYCTATLVAPDVVLTAGKCLAFSQWLFGSTTAQPRGLFLLGSNLDLEKPIVPNVAGFEVVGQTANDPLLEKTLVLVRLTAPVPGARPATLATALPARGEATSIFGYGCSTKTWDDGVLRTTKVTWGSLFGSSATCDAGDRGAPLFDARGGLVGVVTDDGAGKLLGRDTIVAIPKTDETDFAKAIGAILGSWGRR